MSPEEPLYQRDPQAWRKHLAEGNPNKPVNVSVLTPSFVTNTVASC
jgi:hypothetical protein